jgi:hypothetical protein
MHPIASDSRRLRQPLGLAVLALEPHKYKERPKKTPCRCLLFTLSEYLFWGPLMNDRAALGPSHHTRQKEVAEAIRDALGPMIRDAREARLSTLAYLLEMAHIEARGAAGPEEDDPRI